MGTPACAFTLLLMAVSLPYSSQLIKPASSVPSSNTVPLTSSPPLPSPTDSFPYTRPSKLPSDPPDGGSNSLAPNGGAYISIKDPHKPGFFSPVLPLTRALYFPPPEIPRPDFGIWANAPSTTQPAAPPPEPPLSGLHQHRIRQVESLTPSFKFTIRNLGRIADQASLLLFNRPPPPSARSKLDPDVESSTPESSKKIRKTTSELTSSTVGSEEIVVTTAKTTTTTPQATTTDSPVSADNTSRWSRRRRFSREDLEVESTTPPTTSNASHLQVRLIDADSTSAVERPPSPGSSADLPLETSNPFGNGGGATAQIAVPASPVVTEGGRYEVNRIAGQALPSSEAANSPPPQSSGSTSNCAPQIIYLPAPALTSLPSSPSVLQGQTASPPFASAPTSLSTVSTGSGGCQSLTPPHGSSFQQSSPPTAAPIYPPTPPSPTPNRVEPSLPEDITGYESQAPAPESPPPQPSQHSFLTPISAPPPPAVPTAILPPFPPPSASETTDSVKPTESSSEYESVNSEHGAGSSEGSAESYVGRQGATIPLDAHGGGETDYSTHHESHSSSSSSSSYSASNSGGNVHVPANLPLEEVKVPNYGVRKEEEHYGVQAQTSPPPTPPLPSPHTQQPQLPQAVPLPLQPTYAEHEEHHQSSKFGEAGRPGAPAPYIPQPHPSPSAVPTSGPIAPQLANHEYNSGVRPPAVHPQQLPPPRQPHVQQTLLPSVQHPQPPPPPQQPYVQQTLLPSVQYPQQFQTPPPRPIYVPQPQIPQRPVPWTPPYTQIPYRPQPVNQQKAYQGGGGCLGNLFNRQGGWPCRPVNYSPCQPCPCRPSYGYGGGGSQCNPCSQCSPCWLCNPCSQFSCSNGCSQYGGSGGGCFTGQQCAPVCGGAGGGGGYNPCQAANSCYAPQYAQQPCQIPIIIQCCCPSRQGWCRRRRARNKRSLAVLRHRR